MRKENVAVNTVNRRESLCVVEKETPAAATAWGSNIEIKEPPIRVCSRLADRAAIRHDSVFRFWLNS